MSARGPLSPKDERQVLNAMRTCSSTMDQRREPMRHPLRPVLHDPEPGGLRAPPAAPPATDHQISMRPSR
jgi:hypothetical protein